MSEVDHQGGMVATDAASADVIWAEITTTLREQLAESVWFSTFHDVAARRDGSILVLTVPSTLARERIISRYLPMITESLRELGRAELEVIVESNVVEGAPPEPAEVAERPPVGEPVQLSVDLNEGVGVDDAGLNPRYTFDTFVKGLSNQFALAAALRVAETPARSYNPLFIYGSAGLGKTHLLHAIGQYVRLNYQHHEVRYVSTETFMNEYVDAIRANSMAHLRRRYRDVDVLLIDDV